MSETLPNNVGPTPVGGYGKQYSDLKNSRFNLFRQRRQQAILNGGIEIVIPPLNSSVDPYPFMIHSNPSRWIDPQTLFFCGRYRVRNKTHNRAPAETENFSVVNNTPHSLWKRIDVRVNGVKFDEASDTYHNKAYIETLMNIPDEFKKTVLESTCVWSYDSVGGSSTTLKEWVDSVGAEPDKFEEETVETSTNNGVDWTAVKIRKRKKVRADGYNEGYVKRRRGNMVGRWMDFQIVPQHDIITSDNVFPPHLCLEILMYRNHSNMCIIKDANNANTYTIELDNLHFTGYLFETTARVLAWHQRMLANGRKPQTEIRRNRVNYFTIPAGRREVGKPNYFFTEPLPQQILICFVDYAAFFGSDTTNPFYYRKLELQEASIVVNGQHHPFEKYSTTNEGGELRCYHKFLQATGSAPNFPQSVPISFEMYTSNYFFLAWDRTINQDGGFFNNGYESCGSIGIHLVLQTALQTNMIAIVYASNQEDLIFDKDKTRFKDVPVPGGK